LVEHDSAGRLGMAWPTAPCTATRRRCAAVRTLENRALRLADNQNVPVDGQNSWNIADQLLGDGWLLVSITRSGHHVATNHRNVGMATMSKNNYAVLTPHLPNCRQISLAML
jgi:hypothetical protein